MWSTVLAAAAGLFALLYLYTCVMHSYWQRRGVPYLSHFTWVQTLYLLGTGKLCHWEFVHKEMYKRFGHLKLLGLYEMGKPLAMLFDREMIQNVCIKDFDHFVDRAPFEFRDGADNYMNEMLSITEGDHWKKLRSVMTPTFTSGKMKNMFYLVKQKADRLVQHLKKESEEGGSVDIKEASGKFTMDVIASCAFGIEVNSLGGENNKFTEHAKEMFDFTLPMLLKMMLLFILPKKLIKILNITNVGPAWVFFKNVAEETIAQRHRETGERRHDFLDLMLEACQQNDEEEQKSQIDAIRNEKEEKFTVSQRSVLAQAVTFIVAGYETTGSAITFAAFLLAKHPEAQQRLREEILNVLQKEGELTYRGVMEAKFLDAVLAEALRLYPPAIILERRCTKDYILPGTCVDFKKGMVAQVPAWSIHHDPHYWPEPEEFRPDRFMPENRSNIKPGTYMPFGIGPRNCIAMRFAQMEAKLALVAMVQEFDLSLQPSQEELKLDSTFGFLRPAREGIQITVSQRHTQY